MILYALSDRCVNIWRLNAMVMVMVMVVAISVAICHSSSSSFRLLVACSYLSYFPQSLPRYKSKGILRRIRKVREILDELHS